MTDSELIKSFIDEYRLNVNGVRFWTPYFVNKAQVHDDRKRRNSPAPHLGKGSPHELREAVLEALGRVRAKPESADEYRQFMHDNLIGVECSGFAYYVYDQFLKRSRGTTLDDHLFWDKQELLEAYDRGIPWHQPSLERAAVEGYPDVSPLSSVALQWGWKTPRLLVRAERFWHESASNEVSLLEARVGDMIICRESTGSNIGHLMILTEVSDEKITYAHSSRLDNTIGGVHYGQIEVIDRSLAIEGQRWRELEFLKTHHEYGLRRLKVLDD